MAAIRASLHHIKNLSRAFWVVIAASFMNQVGNMAFVFLVLYLAKHLGFTLSQSSFAFVIFSASMLLTGLFAGPYVDRIGAARLMTATILLNGLLLLIFPLLHHFALIALACTLWGLAYGLYRAASQTFIGELSSAGMHKITYSVYRLAVNLGMSIGPAIGGFLAMHSFAAIFIANGMANVLAGIILIIGLRTGSWFKWHKREAYKPVINLRWLLLDKSLSIFLLGMIPVSMVFYQHEATLPIFLNHHLHLPLSFYGLLFTLNTLIIAVFELPLNVATLHWPYRVNFMVGSLFITMGFAGFAFAHVSWHIVLLTIIWTIGEMILYPSASSFIADLAHQDRRASYMSLFSSCTNLGMMLGPWAGAIVMQHYGPFVLWIVCGVWGLLSLAFFWTTPQPRTA